VPEGDTIHRAAAALRIALVGKPSVTFEAPRLVGPHPAKGRVIERVESHGKHLEIVWDDGLTLHTHMRMSGSWHLYRIGERWRRPVSQLRVLIEVSDWLAVCFNAPVVETYRHFDRHRHPGFGPLGPDLCTVGADLDESINRLYHHPDQTFPICEALLDQHVVCGVGNVYRCETLWACATDPFAPVGSVDADLCAELVTTAARLLRANLTLTEDATLGTRRTLEPVAGDAGFGRSGLAVYGRNGQRCRRCGDTIEVRRTGEHARLLYWCPGCQVRGAPAAGRPPATAVEQGREMDPHPAAMRYLADLPWRRHRPTA
jgi:endonuclease-8